MRSNYGEGRNQARHYTHVSRVRTPIRGARDADSGCRARAIRSGPALRLEGIFHHPIRPLTNRTPASVKNPHGPAVAVGVVGEDVALVLAIAAACWVGEYALRRLVLLA